MRLTDYSILNSSYYRGEIIQRQAKLWFCRVSTSAPKPSLVEELPRGNIAWRRCLESCLIVVGGLRIIPYNF